MRDWQLAGRARGRRAVTLAELIVALSILTIGMAGLHSLLSASDRATGRVQTRMKAAEIARRGAAQFALLPWSEIQRQAASTSESTRFIALRSLEMAGPVEYASIVLMWEGTDGGIRIEGRAWMIPPDPAARMPATGLPVDPPLGVLAESSTLVVYPPGAPISAAASPSATDGPGGEAG